MSSYGRPQFAFPRLTHTVKAIIIGLLGFYVTQLVLENWAGVPVSALLAMEPGGPLLWQLATYVLIDGGLRDARSGGGEDDTVMAERMQLFAASQARTARLQPMIDDRD